MNTFLPTRSQIIGLGLSRRLFARRHTAEGFDMVEATRQSRKISKPDQKKGG